MGGVDKFLLTIDDKKILTHIIERLSPQVHKLILNINGPIERVNEFPIEVVPDIKKDKNNKPLGPLGGLYTALLYASESGYSHVVTVSCDTPFLPDDFVERLWKHHDTPVSLAKSNGRLHPVLAMWNVSLMAELEIYLDQGNRKMMDWVHHNPTVEVVWDETPDPFININSMEDLKKARQRYS